MYRLFKLDLSRIEQRNAWYLVVEMFWASMLSAAATFNAAYAIRLGATNTEVSLLSSVPALMAVLISIPTGQFLQKRPRRKPWLLWSLGLHRFGYLFVILVPWLPLEGAAKGLVLVLGLVTISLPAHFFNVGWIPMLSEVIPENMRASVFSARNIFYNAVLSVCGLLFGFWLERIPFAINYQSLYFFGFVCSMVSLYFVAKVEVPDSPYTPAEGPAPRTLKGRMKLLRQALDSQPAFLRITINTWLHGVGVWMVGPVYVLFFVKELGANEGWLGLNGTVASVATIIGYTLWRSIIQRRGELSILRLTIICVGLYPVVVGLVQSLPLILIATALNGLLVPGVNLSHFNTLLKVTPEKERPGYTALYMTAANIGAFVSPFVGIALANAIGFAPTLIICGLLSVIGSFSFWIWPVMHTAQAETAQV